MIQRSNCRILYPSHSVLSSHLPWIITFLFLPHLFLASICIFPIRNLSLIFRLNRVTSLLNHQLQAFSFNQHSVTISILKYCADCLGLLTKMLANLPVEIILLSCEYLRFKELEQLAWTSNRMMRIIKKYRPMALERKVLFYRKKILLHGRKLILVFSGL